MKKNKLKFILIYFLLLLLSNCGGFREAFEGNKRSEQNDEFLVKKKSPLQMPPDINKLPMPGDGDSTADSSKPARKKSKWSGVIVR